MLVAVLRSDLPTKGYSMQSACSKRDDRTVRKVRLETVKLNKVHT